MLTKEMTKWVTRIAEKKQIRPHQLVSGIIAGYAKRYGETKEPPIDISTKLEAWLTEIASELKISIPQLIVRAVNFYIMTKKNIRRYEEESDFPKTTRSQETKSQETKPQNPDPWA
jgi:hypothetical protein